MKRKTKENVRSLMRGTVQITVSVFLILMIFSGNVFAENYHVKVKGIRVTDTNKDDVLSDGTVSYDNTTKTITLNNANIAAGYEDGILIDETTNSYIINLIGNNVITGNLYGIKSQANLTVKGDGTINIATGMSINASNSNLTIEDCTVVAKGQMAGVLGEEISGQVGNLIVKNANLKAKGGMFGSVANFASISLVDCQITSPSGATYADGSVKVGGEICTDTVIISPVVVTTVSYPVHIAGTQVTDANKDDVLSDGTVSYDPSTHTITLNNSDISAGSNDGLRIDTTSGDYNIILSGTNSISSDNYGIYFNTDLTVKGSGTLNINAAYGIYAYESSLSIEDCRVNVVSLEYGISAEYSDSDAVLTVKNANLKSIGEYVSIADFASISLVDCQITSPSGATYADGAVKVGGEICTDTVIISPVSNTYYPVYISGVQIHDLNKDDVLSDGSVSYDPATNTINLTDANIVTVGTDNGIYVDSTAENYTVNLLGTTNIISNSYGVKSKSNLTVKGSGILNIEAQQGISVSECNLNIEDCRITSIGSMRGISGTDTGSEVLTVSNATIQAKGVSEGSILSFNSIVFNTCQITSPQSADYSDGIVKVGGNIYKDTVFVEPIVIVSYPVYISGIQLTDANKDDVLSDGTVSYDNITKTITLNNANIVVSSDISAIEVSATDGDYIINLVGDNHIDSDSIGVVSHANLTIQGNGTLDINAAYGIYAIGCNLTIENSSITSTSSLRGITGTSTGEEELIVNNANISAEGSGEGSIMDFDTITFNNSYISTPQNADYSDGSVRVGDEVFKGLVVIVQGMPSGIDLHAEKSLNNAWGGDGVLYIENNSGKESLAEIFSIRGYRVAAVPLSSGINSKVMEKGVYVVVIGLDSFKVFVK